MLGKSKILDYENEWYDEIDPNSFYEKDLENTILSKMKSVFPNYFGVPFSLKISNTDGETSVPDFVLIRKDYKEWYVVEVEMSRHSWDTHVEKQVRVFSSGIYPKDKVAEYIYDKDKSLLLESLKFMIDNYPPKVLVIVNEHMPEWEEKIRKYDSYLSVFQIYKGTNGVDVFRVAGDTPLIVKDKSHCAFLKGGSNILEVYSPSIFKEMPDNILEITYNGKKTKWKIMSEKDRLFLISVGYNILQIEKKFVIFQSESNDYYMRIN